MDAVVKKKKEGWRRGLGEGVMRRGKGGTERTKIQEGHMCSS